MDIDTLKRSHERITALYSEDIPHVDRIWEDLYSGEKNLEGLAHWYDVAIDDMFTIWYNRYERTIPGSSKHCPTCGQITQPPRTYRPQYKTDTAIASMYMASGAVYVYGDQYTHMWCKSHVDYLKEFRLYLKGEEVDVEVQEDGIMVLGELFPWDEYVTKH